MLKFRDKKKNRFPTFSLIIWIVTLAVMVSSYFFYQKGFLNETFAIKPNEIISQIKSQWLYLLKLLSSLFVHGSWKHWFGNMILFLIIAFPLEKRIGGFWFLLIYFTAGFAGNLYCIYYLSGSENYLIGASGAVSGILGAWIVLFPSLKISIIIPIGFYMQKAEIPVLLLSLIWLGIQIVLQLVSPLDYSIVWISHVVGFITGFSLAWLYRIAN